MRVLKIVSEIQLVATKRTGNFGGSSWTKYCGPSRPATAAAGFPPPPSPIAHGAAWTAWRRAPAIADGPPSGWEDGPSVSGVSAARRCGAG